MKDHAEEVFDEIIADGESAIDQFIADREAESLFLDFKRSSTDGVGKKLDQSDRSHLARAISGFGNSEGGVIVWGIDCRTGEDYADVARAKYPLENPQRFLSWLQGAVSSATIPPHRGVRNVAITADGSKGFCATYIPKSDNAPHQIIASGRGQYHYLIRAGSDFIPTPHAVLAGMFGRRPQPAIFQNFAVSTPDISEDDPIGVETALGIRVGNGGRGIASNVFMIIWFRSLPGPNCKLSVEMPDQMNWQIWRFNQQYTAISKNDLRLPPQVHLQPLTAKLTLAPPFTNKIRFDGLCGSSEAPSFSFSVENDPKTIERFYNHCVFCFQNGKSLPEYEEVDFWNIVEGSELASSAYRKQGLND